ncbi:MAG TPA: MFS transporter [candidate division Zixibacteria bacterium]|nr:MFS transporter [candidate division Zixibacteria bacterium]
MEASQIEKSPTIDDINLQDVGEKSSAIEVLRNAPFMLLFAAQFTQNVGAAVSWLALQFLIFHLTGSPGLMGLLSIIFWLPYVLFTPLAGVYTDRFDQRKIMLLANLISFFASFGFIIIYLLKDILTIDVIITIVDSGKTTITHSLNYIHVLWPLYILTFINSTAASFFFPARSAYTRLIVQKKNLLVANSIGTTVFQIATIVGYVLAGVLAARSYLWSFIFDASTFAFSFTMVLLIIIVGQKPPDVVRPPEETFRTQVKGIFEDISIGFRTIRDTPKVSYMLIIFASAIFSYSSFSVLFIVVLNEEMGLNETWYGIMQAIMGISGIITALILMSIGKIKRKILMLNFALAGLSIVLMFFAFIRNIWVMGVILFLFGIGLVMINIPAPTLIQEQIPYEKQGRVFGTQQLIQGAARLLGMGIVSLIAEIVLPMYIFIVAASILGIIIIWGFIYSSKKGISGTDYLANGEAKISYSE